MVSGELEQHEFLPLRLLSEVLTVLLGVVVASIAARLVGEFLSLHGVHWRWNAIFDRLDQATDITIFGTSILFVVWFRRARINAEPHGYRQRRARGWTFWGWVVPIVDMWIPFQLMGDIWRAGLSEERRHKIAWLPALWWTCWLLSGLSFGTGSSATTSPIPHLAAHTYTVSLCLLAAAGAVLIAIIRIVSNGPVGSPLPSLAYAP